MPQKVYIAGPMSSVKQLNFPMFFEVAKDLENKGYDVINPAQMDLDNGVGDNSGEFWRNYDPSDGLQSLNLSEEDYYNVIKRDVEAILSFSRKNNDFVVALPGWKNSKGATAEICLAQWMGLEIKDIYLDKINLENPSIDDKEYGYDIQHIVLDI